MTGGRKASDRGSTANRRVQRIERAPAAKPNRKLTVSDVLRKLKGKDA